MHQRVFRTAQSLESDNQKALHIAKPNAWTPQHDLHSNEGNVPWRKNCAIPRTTGPRGVNGAPILLLTQPSGRWRIDLVRTYVCQRYSSSIRHRSSKIPST